ncbi:hypothetical protein DFJ73DRAFT_787036 [Zopfochytrium polystomum]|nr:hypothetical protein DFJ73DRAFT_787036 [Zopfochytrium polystomum]
MSWTFWAGAKKASEFGLNANPYSSMGRRKHMYTLTYILCAACSGFSFSQINITPKNLSCTVITLIAVLGLSALLCHQATRVDSAKQLSVPPPPRPKRVLPGDSCGGTWVLLAYYIL